MTARIEGGDGSPASPRYAVLVVRGLLADGGSAVHGLLPPGVARVLIVHPESMEQRAAVLAAGLRERGLTVHLGLVPDAEAAKTATVAAQLWHCLLYTSDAADERSSVDLGGRRILKKKTIYDQRHDGGSHNTNTNTEQNTSAKRVTQKT